MLPLRRDLQAEDPGLTKAFEKTHASMLPGHLRNEVECRSGQSEFGLFDSEHCVLGKVIRFEFHRIPR